MHQSTEGRAERRSNISLAGILDGGRPALMKSAIVDSVRRRWEVNRDEFDEY